MPKPFEDYNKQKRVMLICWINLCPHIEFALGQRSGGGLSLHGQLTLQWRMHGTFFALYRSKKIVCLNSKERLWWQSCYLLEEIDLQNHWHFHEKLQAMWSLIPKIKSLWTAHQSIVAVNTVVVDQCIYVRNVMLPYILTVWRTIIHETQNVLYCFLLEVLIM